MCVCVYEAGDDVRPWVKNPCLTLLCGRYFFLYGFHCNKIYCGMMGHCSFAVAKGPERRRTFQNKREVSHEL